MANILVVDDNENARRLYELILKPENYTVFLASSGKQALNIVEEKHVDIIILDVMMPEMDGFRFAEILREQGYSTPILMITAKDTMADKHRGFLAGTDDYMVKPVDEVEMLLRVKALLRRAKISADKSITVGETELINDSFAVKRGDAVVTLPKKEFLILFKLLSYPKKTFTRAQLMEEIWDMDSESEERTIDVHINRLREKFSSNTDFKITTIRGLGYKAEVSNL